ncbi:DUF2938 domain-containing protein [Pseudoponticoccus marisrubri]|uniref:DUF2938 domain-containing protein n=1 Tax=Pseudoponticoccus marisrubri TaxID=1685382 RepID=A0A0W7WQB4_9RHOB|nr:DUF2938 domain-containing protein [Pseudoponticoccus marisrubri]KUF12802.1 hypothetical protein AVJ23_03585 [Pseudoponticoccus marisrubri]
MDILFTGILIGLGGTIAMDLWALLLNRTLGQGLPNWGNVGRWVGHLPGRVFHDDIGAATPLPGETAIGWAFHYAVGIFYGVIFMLLVGPGWAAAPTFLPAWIFALVTIAAGWFLLQPGMGLGWALSRTETPMKGRAMGLVAHTVFGLGMWVTALIV